MPCFSAVLRQLLVAASLAAGVGGCTGHATLRVGVEQQLSAGRPQEALALLEQGGTPERDRVPYWLDKAMLLRQAGEYADSNDAFEAAKAALDELTALSLREQGTAVVINETMRSYVSPPFEQAMLHAYAALNYLDLDDPAAARVEALQLDVRLERLRQEGYEALAEDPFARYITGVVFELNGERGEALIGYRKALDAIDAHRSHYVMGVPAALKRDMLRLTAALGLDDEYERLLERFGEAMLPASVAADEGEVVVLFHSGLAPIKEEHRVVVGPPEAARIVSIALPRYQVRHNGVTGARVHVAGRSVQTDVMADVDALAVANLDQALPAITARALLRAVTKYKVADRADERGGTAAGLATNIVGLLTERADTRSWLTLPAQVQIARFALPAGQRTLELEMLDEAGRVIERATLPVTVTPGGLAVVSYRWIPPMIRRH